ncbi:hypothetical protein [Macrococcus armenti]|uniref:hypothetical protein n=1 Tax=Macrococcus armenti TaxID=2875764 RepID=UPI001CCC90D2|nr:hypothetical protein [Macrococcus armenti]UBH15004.1 hypothetical protein LAU44_09715 [Macrococcus armenti]UBH17363.1 hypothetical protein LAU39_09740 [Macrococcus armenti]UBH19628.1 hypothetical protein LAU40_09720 [Macrococcus armenti]
MDAILKFLRNFVLFIVSLCFAVISVIVLYIVAFFFPAIDLPHGFFIWFGLNLVFSFIIVRSLIGWECIDERGVRVAKLFIGGIIAAASFVMLSTLFTEGLSKEELEEIAKFKKHFGLYQALIFAALPPFLLSINFHEKHFKK